MARRARLVTALLVTTAWLAGCSSSADGAADRQLLVFAAASLGDAFSDVAAAFEDGRPDIDVALHLAGSSTLREQLLGGAPADVFASADSVTMDQAVAAGTVATEPVVFATNRLAIAVPAGNPAGVTGLGDFADDSLYLGLCAEAVPCGRLARELLEDAGVLPSVDTHEPDVRALLTKIAACELDAGITYLTDVAATPGVDGLDIPDDLDVTADYPIAVADGAPDPDAAAAFVAFVLSEEGRGILDRHGFGRP